MAEPDDVLDQLAQLKVEYEQLDAAREQVKERIVAAAVTAFQQDKEPADIYARTPFSHVWLRARVREAGVPKAKPGTKPRKRTAVMPKPAVMRTTKSPSRRKDDA